MRFFFFLFRSPQKASARSAKYLLNPAQTEYTATGRAELSELQWRNKGTQKLGRREEPARKTEPKECGGLGTNEVKRPWE